MGREGLGRGRIGVGWDRVLYCREGWGKRVG